MRIGDVIRTEREKKGMTQAVLAEKVYVTVQAVSGWENGKSIPDIYNLGYIADALKIGKSALMTDEMKSIDRAMYRFREREKVARNFLKYGLDPKVVAQNTELPLYWVIDLKKEMELAEV